MMDVNNQIKTEGNLAVELKHFYGSSQAYLKRLERHDEEPLHHILNYAKQKYRQERQFLIVDVG